MRLGFLCIVLLGFLLPVCAQNTARKAPSAKAWEKLEGVSYKPQRWDDGDSFHVTLADGKELILRLYFVDTCEEEVVYADRIRDQSAYFGITDDETTALGHAASAFTRKVLTRPFTVRTRWHKALGRSKQDRWYAMIITADGKDLAEELIRNGFARIYGTKTTLWDGRTSKQYNAMLAELETWAKAAKKGGWRTSNPRLATPAPVVRAEEFAASKGKAIFHKVECKSVMTISPGNLVTYRTRDEASKDGKMPCAICKP